MINFLLCQYLIHHFDNEEYKENEDVVKMLKYCKEKRTLYCDKKNK